MTNNYMPSKDYKARQGSGAFLQCYDEQGGYLLIEFWLPGYGRFVEHLNSVFRK